MKRYWTEEKINYLKSIVSGKPLEDITKLYNEHFNADLSKSRIKTAMSNYHLKSGYKYDGHKALLFTTEQIKWLTENRIGFNFDVTTEKMNKRFGTNYKVSQVRGWCHAHHLPNGMDMKFPKGHVSFNKGRKGFYAPGCEKGWFKKGHRPYNSVCVDTEVINDDGYIKVKIAEPNKWELKHRLVWQKKYGKIPKDSCLIFLNGNRKDCRIENLMLIKRSILAVLNNEKLIFEDAAATKCGVTMAMIKLRISELKKRKS
jgi:hypothetical protein